jgi:hypothetical protein
MTRKGYLSIYPCSCCRISEKFYRAIPRVDPIQIIKVCGNCEFKASHKKLMSHNTFHLKGGKVPWGEGRFSSASAKGSDAVSIDEP